MAVAELKQASSQPDGELSSELKNTQAVIHQPKTQLPGQLYSELPVPRPKDFSSELLSELLSESPTITSGADSTLTNAPGSVEALTSTSQLPRGSPSLSADLDSTPPTSDTPISENTLPLTSELPSESPNTTPQLDVTLTKATVSDDALPLTSELPSESPNTTPQLDVTLIKATVSNDALAANNKEVAAQIPSRLTGVALARRLGVAPGSISRNKQKENFGAWTSKHDPEGIAWKFDGQTFERVSSSPAF